MGEAGGSRDSAIEADTRTVGGDAMERFRPPLVGRDAKAGDSCSTIGELEDLFIEGEEGDEGLDSGGDGEGGVAEGIGAEVGSFAGELRTWVVCYSDW